jgi:HD-GYP domain-containing protein (c-di-GMP phosphodiesterase class II)
MSVRPYKPAWSFYDAADYVINNKGSMFDPAVVAVFEKKLTKIKEVADKYKDN